MSTFISLLLDKLAEAFIDAKFRNNFKLSYMYMNQKPV